MAAQSDERRQPDPQGGRGGWRATRLLLPGSLPVAVFLALAMLQVVQGVGTT